MLLSGTISMLLTASAWGAEGVSLRKPADRPDRLVSIVGVRASALTAEFWLESGEWRPATIYVGDTVDQWRTGDVDAWNRGVLQGRLPAGDRACVWNWVYDCAPVGEVKLRLRTDDGEVVLAGMVDLPSARNMLVIDARNAAELAGGELPEPWRAEGGSIFCPADDPLAPALSLRPALKGWYRIYVGMEAPSALRVLVTGEEIAYPVPDYQKSPKSEKRMRREYYLKSADMTGQDLRLALGGTVPEWHDACVRHVRFVPMKRGEVRHWHRARRISAERGRPFAGYVEQCTASYYEPGDLDLRSHTRNEMRLNRVRGASDVYVHVIRAGVKAWYHSDAVERCIPEPGETADGWVKFGRWMAQADPMQVAVEEARAERLRVFADMGMNVTYITKDPSYSGLAERMPREHPEYLVPGHTMFMDYRHQAVRSYVLDIARELMTKYDVDGINLDFARFAHNKAYDEPSLVDVVARIHEARREAEAKWGHAITVATRIPSYRYATNADWSKKSYGGEHPWFTAALATWAREAWIDRVMVCCPLADNQEQLSLERYRNAVEGTAVELWGDLYVPGERSRRACLDVARSWVAQGLDGGFFFYTVNRPTEFEQINWMLRLIDFPDVPTER